MDSPVSYYFCILISRDNGLHVLSRSVPYNPCGSHPLFSPFVLIISERSDVERSSYGAGYQRAPHDVVFASLDHMRYN